MEMKEIEESVLKLTVKTEYLIKWYFKNETKADVTYLLMKMTKITDRVDVLENRSNDENEATKSVGAVNIEFTGKFLKITAPSVSKQQAD